MLIILTSALVALKANRPRWLILIAILFITALILSLKLPTQIYGLPLEEIVIVKICFSLCVLIAFGAIKKFAAEPIKIKLTRLLSCLLAITLLAVFAFAYIGHCTVKKNPIEQFPLSRPMEVTLLAGNNIPFLIGQKLTMVSIFPSSPFDAYDGISVPKKFYEIDSRLIGNLLSASSKEEVAINYAQLSIMMKAQELLHVSPKPIAQSVAWVFDF